MTLNSPKIKTVIHIVFYKKSTDTYHYQAGVLQERVAREGTEMMKFTRESINVREITNRVDDLTLETILFLKRNKYIQRDPDLETPVSHKQFNYKFIYLILYDLCRIHG